jgi:hypothetical protein
MDEYLEVHPPLRAVNIGESGGCPSVIAKLNDLNRRRVL